MALESESPSLEKLQFLLQLQSIQVTDEDLRNVQKHFTLIASHAKNVMDFPLDEMVEPAPIFHP